MTPNPVDSLLDTLHKIPSLRSQEARDSLLSGIPDAHAVSLGISPEIDLRHIIEHAVSRGRLVSGELTLDVLQRNVHRFASTETQLGQKVAARFAVLRESLDKPTEIPPAHPKQLPHSQGDDRMSSRNLVDWLVDTLDLLRHNARSVLIERWEKRNLGQAVTPPVFDDQPRTREQLRASLPAQDVLVTKLRGYRKVNGNVVVVNENRIKNLRDQMGTAQESVDRYDNTLNKPLGEAEKIQLEYQRDEFQKKINVAVEELADIMAFLYSG